MSWIIAVDGGRSGSVSDRTGLREDLRFMVRLGVDGVAPGGAADGDVVLGGRGCGGCWRRGSVNYMDCKSLEV